MKMGTNNFALEGNVKAIISNEGGKLFADKVEWVEKGGQIIATGNVKLYKEEWFASADMASTTSEFKNLKLKGNAMVEKGGDNQ
jgi:lipopolysaccharide assembly outer membrane protein LptD (OstA)